MLFQLSINQQSSLIYKYSSNLPPLAAYIRKALRETRYRPTMDACVTSEELTSKASQPL